MRPLILFVFILLSIPFGTFAASESDAVWVDGTSFYDHFHGTKSITLYFPKWKSTIPSYLNSDKISVAIQLDSTLCPKPSDQDELPSLKALSTIKDHSLIDEYLAFFQNYCRTVGIEYVVLPDTTDVGFYEKALLVYAANYSPYFFLKKSYFSFSLPSSKKDFNRTLTDQATIWVTRQGESVRKVQRWAKNEKRHQSAHRLFYSRLEQAKGNHFRSTAFLGSHLKNELFQQGVVLEDPEKLIPIRNSEMVYLGKDTALRNVLSRYATVHAQPKEGLLTIWDATTAPQVVPSASSIYIGSLDGELKKASAALKYPFEVDGQPIYIGKMLFGAMPIVGQSENAREQQNLRFLGQSDPALEGMDPSILHYLDTLAAYAIKSRSTPGIQLAVAKGGALVWEKRYGYYTYDSLRAVTKETMYDLASVTKTMATLPAIALLLDRGLINLDDSISHHLSAFKGSNKSAVTIRQLLAHQGGIQSYIPFWSMMLDGDRLDAFYYKTPEDEAQDIRSYGLEPHPAMVDSLKSFIVHSDLIDDPKKARYSDLGFMILHLIVEAASGLPLDEFLAKEFYEPMGMTQTYFNPRMHQVAYEEIAPTEFDHRYRKYQVWGEVHDRNALVFGGVAGHAGLFSTAQDLAKMLSMFLNGGYYGGRQYLSKAIVSELNARHFSQNARGLGWDKKKGIEDTASSAASDASFGHTGFTGTMVWADPEQDLIFIFLSNRVYPNADNWKLARLNIRTKMHDIVYRSLQSSR